MESKNFQKLVDAVAKLALAQNTSFAFNSCNLNSIPREFQEIARIDILY